MDLLGQYGDDDDEEEEIGKETAPSNNTVGGAKAKQAAKKPPFAGEGLSLALPTINAAPDVDLLGQNQILANAVNPSAKKIFTNPTFALLDKPLKGPLEVGQQNLEQSSRTTSWDMLRN